MRLIRVDLPAPEGPSRTPVSAGCLAGDAAGDQHWCAQCHSFQLGQECVGRLDDVGFCHQDYGHGSALPCDREVALDAPSVDIGRRGDDERHVDVGRQDLLFGFPGRDLSRKDGAAFEDAVNRGHGVAVEHRHPVAHRGQQQGVVSQVASGHRSGWALRVLDQVLHAEVGGDTRGRIAVDGKRFELFLEIGIPAQQCQLRCDFSRQSDPPVGKTGGRYRSAPPELLSEKLRRRPTAGKRLLQALPFERHLPL